MKPRFTIQVRMAPHFDGGTNRTVACYGKLAPLVVHKTVDERGYTITHVMSGYSVTPSICTLREAQWLCSKLLQSDVWLSDLANDVDEHARAGRVYTDALAIKAAADELGVEKNLAA